MKGSRILIGIAGVTSALLGVVTVGGGLVYAGQLLPAPARDRTLEFQATMTESGTILLPPDRRACLATFAMLLEGDALVVYGGPVVAGECGPDQTGTVERTVERVVMGDPPLGREIGARFDEYAGLADPGDVGIPFTEVEVPIQGEAEGDLGIGTDRVAPAWRVDGAESPEDWVILVHGRSATRAEALRSLPTVVDSGATALVITYRNDMAGAPETMDAVGRFGQTEWVDLQAAVSYARSEGAQRIVLAGFSQGGSLISYYLRNAGEGEVDGVILDSPLLSLSDTLAQQARLRGLPGPVIPPILFGTRVIAELRSGFAISDVEHVDNLAETTVPMLVIHGDEDDFVPPEPSQALAQARPDNLTFEGIEGAGHVEGWNTDRERYGTAIATFLADVFR